MALQGISSGLYRAACPAPSPFSFPSAGQQCTVDPKDDANIALAWGFINFYCDDGFTFTNVLSFTGTDGKTTSATASPTYSSLPYFTDNLTATFNYPVTYETLRQQRSNLHSCYDSHKICIRYNYYLFIGVDLFAGIH